ncbi:MAG: asparagine synthase (glutamine-hydrolyzing) [Syntrophales bacterium]
MCGICGKIFFEKDKRVDPQLIKIMADSMYHRGPDDEGTYISGNVGLGHRRLSIIDLNRGKQPISNEDGTVWIVFNGEIYNYQDLRETLIQRDHKFKTDTDTEVIVHAYEEFGEDCVKRLRGMFAFAIWDDRNQALLIARDRVGIKPLYYYLSAGQLVFASEMRAILQDSSVDREVNLPIIDRFLTYFYIPGDETLLKSIRKLRPGHCLTVRKGKADIKQYWDLSFTSGNKAHTFNESKEELLGLLKETVRLHMISDVPVGFLLSGGVDSTALLNLSLNETNKDLSTFTIGFDGEDFADERVYARLAAEKFGTKHYEMTIKAQDFVEFLPAYVWHMEEPVCEPPAIALYYVSKLASDHVKVLISGEGGDEAFAGYQNYRNLVWLERLKKLAGPFKRPVNDFLNGLEGVASLGRLEKYVQLISVPFDQYYYGRTSSPFTFFNSMFKEFYSPDFIRFIDKNRSIEPTRRCLEQNNSNDYLSRMLYTDTKTWLPDDLLLKADKITMANSVELRVPLLDHVVLEFAADIPSQFKVSGMTTKHLLKAAFRDLIPNEIIKREKTGFPVPYVRWFNNELYSYAREILLDRETLGRGYFEEKGINSLLQKGTPAIRSKEIFSLIVLELWHRIFISKDCGKAPQ